MGILKIKNVNPVYSVIGFAVGGASSRSSTLNITIGNYNNSIVLPLDATKDADAFRGDNLYTLFNECEIAIGYNTGDTDASHIRLQSLNPNLKAGVDDQLTGITSLDGKTYTAGSGYSLEITSHYEGDVLFIPSEKIDYIKKETNQLKIFFTSGSTTNTLVFSKGTIDTTNLEKYNYLATSSDTTFSDGTYTADFFNNVNDLDVLEEKVFEALQASYSNSIVELQYNSSLIKATL
tara:strand:- start:1293 stop:1997 length:705 start_codon:yes stop_codon:yes gene_type:complete